MTKGRGIWLGVGAFVGWGLTPLFWNLVDDVDVIDLVLHRIVWSIPLLLAVIAFQKRLRELAAALRSPKVMAVLVVAATLLAMNWSIWLWTVTNERIIESSLGYFITPLVSVALGVVFLGERLRRLQWMAIGIAAFGVIGMTITVGTPPWIAITLAISFGVYGLVKKRDEVPAPLISLTGELSVMFVPALVYLVFFHTPKHTGFGASAGITAFLIFSAFITVAPLLMFGAAAKRIPLTMLGLLQYISPTLHLALGVWLYGEELKFSRLAWFIVVWIALVIYTYDSVNKARTESTAIPAVAAPDGV
jgi:chloramphenicol-sensitive protein RarD